MFAPENRLGTSRQPSRRRILLTGWDTERGPTGPNSAASSLDWIRRIDTAKATMRGMVQASGYSAGVEVGLALSLVLQGVAGQTVFSSTTFPRVVQDKLSAGDDAGIAIGSECPVFDRCIPHCPTVGRRLQFVNCSTFFTFFCADVLLRGGR